MKSVAEDQFEPHVKLLIADDEAGWRLLLAKLAQERVGALAVFEAEDGVEAVQIGLQERPQIALLDVGMSRLGGIEAAITLRGVDPQMRIALSSGELHAHGDRARDQCLPLFDKLNVGRAVRWIELQAQLGATPLTPRVVPQHLNLVCSSCGYGIAQAIPPERCPMCHGEAAWNHRPWRPFTLSS